MATQKKKTSSRAKGSGKGSKSTKNSGKGALSEGEQGFGLVLAGWFLLIVGVLLLLGCVSSVYSGSKGNWLGPYLGAMIPNAVTFLFGKVSVLFFTVSLVLWGVGLAFAGFRSRVIRYALGMTLLSLDLSFLLALKSYGVSQVSKDVLLLNGGVLGQFFTQNIAIPVFGTASSIAPLCILLVCLVLILVLSFGLRPRHFRFVAQGTSWLKSVFAKKPVLEPDVVELDSDYGDDEHVRKAKASSDRGVRGLPRGVTMDDNTVMLEPDEFKIRRKGKVVPFSGRNNWLENDLDINNVEEMPGEIPEAEKDAGATIAAGASAAPTLAAAETAGGEDPEIARLQEFLRLNERHMNALEIVEVKEKIAALRRARDLIDWERGHKGRMQVKGDVRRSEGNAPEVAAAAEVAAEPTMVAGTDATVVAGADSTVVAGMSCEEVASRETMKTSSVERTINAEDLLGGDGARRDDMTTSGNEDFDNDGFDSPAEGQDDTFTPVVYGADANEDGTIAAGHGASIPQPDPTAHFDTYKVPSISEILNDHEVQTADYTEDELNAIGKMLEEKLENFKVKGRVIGCETGPMITRFEVEPGPGVKVSRFTALQEDLAMPLRVSSVRILAPIPGKAAVGIEIPNRKFQTVYSKDVFESEKFAPTPDKIQVALGKDITGEAFTMDLAKAPHLLIAGQTGSGKSVCINALMASMLFSKTPDELRMILVDPKAVELKMYESIPHLLAPVITKPEIAIQALQWLCYEMDRRTEVLATAKVRNIGGFNAKYEAGELPDDIPDEDKGHRMPFIVVIIDEMADLMMVAGKEIEKSVARLAAKARAVGIHLVLATQRPSVKVITGIIKANLPTRISFKVASQIDARTVMDHAGAEKLLGRGDMLFKAVNDPDPVRVHGAFLSDEEAEKLADACSNQNVYYPQVESFDVSEGGEGDEDGEGGGKNLGKLDPLLFEVACWAVEVSGLSTSAVQRHFSVGYSRAGKIVDQLYGLGVCGPSKGNSKPRAMLVGMDELMQLERSGTFR
ncbi:MAG: DNA translocase FtsK [Fibrobacter sp.]|nr:DNA translocase FtsK [Fibrobacter sp.]